MIASTCVKSLAMFSKHLAIYDHQDSYYDSSESEPLDLLRAFSPGATIKHPSDWSCDECLKWISQSSPQCRLDMFLNLSGSDLMEMGPDEFDQKDPCNGRDLYLQLRNHIRDFENDCRFANFDIDDVLNYRSSHAPQFPDGCSSAQYNDQQDSSSTSSVPDVSCDENKKTFTNLLTWSGGTVVNSKDVVDRLSPNLDLQTLPYDYSNDAANDVDEDKQQPKSESRKNHAKKKTQPCRSKIAKNEIRPKSEKIRLSVFMRQLLEDPKYNPSLLKWIDEEEGIFQIIYGKSKMVADLWGQAKKNPGMTFEKLGRSLRWCRDKTDEFQKVPSSTSIPKKLCFRLST